MPTAPLAICALAICWPAEPSRARARRRADPCWNSPPLFLPAIVYSQSKRAITAEDCVNVRYLNPDDLTGAIRMNPQGTQVAYVVKTPHLAENRNDDQIYVKDLSDEDNVESGTRISQGRAIRSGNPDRNRTVASGCLKKSLARCASDQQIAISDAWRLYFAPRGFRLMVVLL